jgi:hypothetical protein
VEFPALRDGIFRNEWRRVPGGVFQKQESSLEFSANPRLNAVLFLEAIAMAPVSAPTATRESSMSPATPRDHTPETDRRTPARRPAPARPAPAATDDEILGLLPPSATDNAEPAAPRSSSALDDSANASAIADFAAAADPGIPEPIRAALDANPDLRRAWDDAQAFRDTFASPEAARAATAQLADLDRLDALFFSRRPEDHAELARTVASLDPAAFASLAKAMQAFVAAPPAADGSSSNTMESPGNDARRTNPASPQSPGASEPSAAQSDFFHATNAAAVQSVLDAIETQVERLLPENISKSARTRVVGEIYRELDATLGSNRQLAQQMRDVFRSGALDAEHQRAVVTLVTSRARQALPGVAKRVLNEWTSTVVAAHNDRRARQQAAERRVDIGGSGGSGSDGPRSMTPREIDYRRMSDADILNL